MKAEKQRAVLFLVCGATLLTLTTVAAAAHPERLEVAPGRSVAYLLLGPYAGLVLSGLGWVRLRKAKANCPGQSWWEFLREELRDALVVLVVLLYGGVCALMGKSLLPVLYWLLEVLHDIETVRYLAH
jgi:hypothetical protein